MRYFLYGLPLLLFAALAVYLWQGLGKDPSVLPSALIDKPAPVFDLAPLAGREPALPFATADLKTGKPVLVNVFASWCVPCKAEHPLITALAEEHGITVHAINYKDKPAEAAAWLLRLGDPYGRVGADPEGRAGTGVRTAIARIAGRSRDRVWLCRGAAGLAPDPAGAGRWRCS